MVDAILVSSEDAKGREEKVGDKIYRYFQNKSGGTLSYGQTVARVNSDSTQVKTPTASDNVEKFAGSVDNKDAPGQTDYSILNDAWGWFLKTGRGKVKFVGAGGSAVAEGGSLKLVDGKLYMEKDQAAGTEPSFAAHAIAEEAGDSAVSILIDTYLNAR